MSSVLIDQTAFAEKIGASRSTFGRLVGSGVVPGHGSKNKIIESEAIVCLVKAGRLDDKGMFITKKSLNQKRMKIEDAPHFSFTGEIKTTVLDDDKVASLKESTRIVENREEMKKRELVWMLKMLLSLKSLVQIEYLIRWTCLLICHLLYLR